MTYFFQRMQVEVISQTETKSSPGILLELYGGKQK
jgi:hypothetical protein